MMASKRGRRDLSKERFWRRVIRRRLRGGVTVRAFCRDEGLTESSYYYWRRELDRRDRENSAGESAVAENGSGENETSRGHCVTSPPASNAGSPPASHAASPFVPVQLVTDGGEPFSGGPIEIVLNSGETVRVPAGFDRRALEGVLRVLETRRC